VRHREHHPRSAENLLRREESDNRRYHALYDIEEDDFSPFDLVLDTTNLSVDEVVAQIESFMNARTEMAGSV
jgi:cytidylate kinase